MRGLDDVSEKGKLFQWWSKLVMNDYEDKPVLLLLPKTKNKAKLKRFQHLK